MMMWINALLRRCRRARPPDREQVEWAPDGAGEWAALPASPAGLFVQHLGCYRLERELRGGKPGSAVVWHAPPRGGKSAGLRHVCRALGLPLFAVAHRDWAELRPGERLALLASLRRRARMGVLALDNLELPASAALLGGLRGEALPAALPGWRVVLAVRTADTGDREEHEEALLRSALPPGLRWSAVLPARPPESHRRGHATLVALQLAGRRYRWPPARDEAPLPPLPHALWAAPDAAELLREAHERDPDPATLAARAGALRGPGVPFMIF